MLINESISYKESSCQFSLSAHCPQADSQVLVFIDTRFLKATCVECCRKKLVPMILFSVDSFLHCIFSIASAMAPKEGLFIYLTMDQLVQSRSAWPQLALPSAQRV